MKKHSRVFDSLEDYFSKMDQACIGVNSIFSNKNAKERHESILMYAFRKYRAACYHLERVKQLITDLNNEMKSSGLQNTEHLPEDAEIKITVIKTADHFVYELSAFFEAMKSSVDFLATACSHYLKEINTDSIRTFIKLVEKNNKNGHIFNVIKKYLSWLKDIREYRHHLVHRMIITTTAGYEIHMFDGSSKKIIYPIIVPRSTPSYLPDTRYFRMFDKDVKYYDCKESLGVTRYPDGTQKIINCSIEYTTSEGYAEISEFMTSHLQKLEEFFYDIIVELISTDFKKI